MKATIALLAAALFAAGCGSNRDVYGQRREVRQTVQERDRAIRAGDADKACSLLTADAKLMVRAFGGCEAAAAGGLPDSRVVRVRRTATGRGSSATTTALAAPAA